MTQGTTQCKQPTILLDNQGMDQALEVGWVVVDLVKELAQAVEMVELVMVAHICHHTIVEMPTVHLLLGSNLHIREQHPSNDRKCTNCKHLGWAPSPHVV